MSDSVRSPGGFARMRNFLVDKKAYFGAIGAAIGSVLIYGSFQGAQAVMYIEAEIPSTAVGVVAYSKINPLPEGQSGAILYNYNSYVHVDEAASPVTTITIFTSTGSSQPANKDAGSANIMSGVIIETANQILTLVDTGAVVATTPVVLAPRDYGTTARKYLNVQFETGSGQTASGRGPAYIRLEIVPCNVSDVGC